jgi:nucleoid-associated protein YgaU
VTAVAVGSPYGVRRPSAVAPAGAGTPLRRVLGSFHEPNAWTVSLLLATGLVIIARHPIAHALGTEAADTAVTVQAPAAVVGSHAVAPTLPSLSAGAAVPTHAPIDPFRPLVTMTGKLLTAAPLAASAPTTAIRTATATTAPSTTAPAVTGPAGPGCAGAMHRVASGDSLWTLAARATRSTDTGRVTIAWHRLYAANRDTLGSNPSLLRVGEQICIPTKI